MSHYTSLVKTSAAGLKASTTYVVLKASTMYEMPTFRSAQYVVPTFRSTQYVVPTFRSA